MTENPSATRVLVFEWLSGGGLWVDEESWEPDSSLVAQGLGMLTAVASDFQLLGCRVDVPLDERVLGDSRWLSRSAGLEPHVVSAAAQLPLERARLAAEVDVILLIAPETGGRLLQAHDWIGPQQNKLISPDREWAALTGDKNRLAEALLSAGFDCLPPGLSLHRFLELDPREQDEWPDPVIKPADGAGSEEVRRMSATQIRQRFSEATAEGPSGWRVEAFVPGMPVSVSAIGRDGAWLTLPPTGQVFDAQPIGHYIDTRCDLPVALADRARRLAMRALEHLPPTNGYVGLDLVLADNPTDDCLIEINPRLTMSYPCLGPQLGQNLAALMLAARRKS